MELRWRMTAQTPLFLLLLAAMLLEILLVPVIYASSAGVAGARAVTGIVLVAALFTIGARRGPIVLLGATLAGHVLEFVHPEAAIQILAATVRVAFLAYVGVAVIARVLRERNVTYDTLAGAACGYMLIGLTFGNLLYVYELIQPGSFTIPATFSAAASFEVREVLLYFSFVTLTTVGYGDVLPANPGAGGLAVAEAIIGQLYLAVTVARLVGLHLAGQRE